MSQFVSKRIFVIDPRASAALADPQPSPRPSSVSRPRATPSPVSTFGSRAEAYDHAADLLRRLKEPVGEIMRQARFGRAVDTSVVAPIVAEVAGSLQTHPSALLTLARVKVKNERAYMHALAVCALMINLGRQMGLDQGSLRDLGMAGLLHDIGETALPPGLLEREVRFGADELALVRGHPSLGHEQLSRLANLPAIVLDVCLNHHERVDGTGYPARIPNARLSAEAKMAAICDVYDAITSYRPYGDCSNPPAGLAEMFSAAGQFDSAILSHFIRSVGIYPAGSLVRLGSGHLALVLDQTGDDLTKPVVRIFYSILDRARTAPRDIDLAADNSDAIVEREEPRKWGFIDWDSQWPHLIRAP